MPCVALSPSRRPTIYDVAERAGVSKSLVSLVLTGSTSVSEQRREAVLRAIDELGYLPSTAAASLAGTRTRTVGLAIEHFANLWFVELLRGAREVLEPEGYQVIVGDHEMTVFGGRDSLDAFASMRVDGVVLAFDPATTPTIRHGIPCVVAGQRVNSPDDVEVVTNDDHAGGRLATEHLIELGHRRIVHVTGRGGAALARRDGYETSMREAGLQPVVIGDRDETNEHPARTALQEHLRADHDLTAVFAANDTMALGCMGALRAAGLSIPDDVSVIGYDDSPLAEASYLDLTTIDSRSLDVGREAAHALLARMSGAAQDPHPRILEPRLVLRSSTAPPVTNPA